MRQFLFKESEISKVMVPSPYGLPSALVKALQAVD